MSSSGNPMNIDDSDVNDIVYHMADLWSHQQDQPNFQGGTYPQGLTDADADFRFNGTRVTVYGVATPKPSTNASAVPPSMSFAIDGGIPITVVSNPDLTETEYAHAFYDSRELAQGEHVLQMNVTYGASDWPFVLDFVQYVPLPLGSASGAGGQDADSDGAGKSGRRSRMGPIVGGVVAGVVVFALAAGLVYWMYIRRRKRRKTKRGSYIYTSSGTKVDLLDQEPKLPPPSPALMSHGPGTVTDVESFYGENGLRYHSRSPSPGTDYLLYTPAGHQHTFSEVDAESRPSSPSHTHTRPNTPSTHANGSLGGYQQSLAPSTTSFGLLSRPGTPSATSAFSGPWTMSPPAAMHRPGPATAYRPATPESLVHLSAGSARAGPSSSSKARQAESHTPKQATFHSDSEMRFREGNTLPGPVAAAPMHASSTASHVSQAKAMRVVGRGDAVEKKEKEKRVITEVTRKATRKFKRAVSYAASAISQVSPMYTED